MYYMPKPIKCQAFFIHFSHFLQEFWTTRTPLWSDLVAKKQQLPKEAGVGYQTQVRNHRYQQPLPESKIQLEIESFIFPIFQFIHVLYAQTE